MQILFADTTEKEVKRKKVNCGSVEEIRKWAQEDLTLIINWLLQQDAKVLHGNFVLLRHFKAKLLLDSLKMILYDVLVAQPEPEELEFTAAQGILVCLEDAVKSLTENQVS